MSAEEPDFQAAAGVLIVLTCIVTMACQMYTAMSLRDISSDATEIHAIRRDVAHIRRECQP